MRWRIFTWFALVLAVRAWSQQGQGAGGAGDSSQMQTPALLSGENYPSKVGSEERSNYLALGLSLTTGYDDNALPAGGGNPVSDVSFMIRPSISFNETTPRQSASVNYSPGFTSYQPNSGLSQFNQSVNGNYSYRISPHMRLAANEVFTKTSGIFNQPDELSGGAISGSPGASPIIVPYADQISNSTGGVFSYQFSLNGMVGATGNYTKFSFPNQTQAAGLFASNSSGGSAFYSGRLTKSQYVGFRYEFSRDLTTPSTEQSEALTHSFEPSYTFLPKPAISISVSAGPQYISASQSGTPGSSNSWGPAIAASMGWQGRRTNFAANYSRAVAGGMGLVGAFQTSAANGALRWKITKDWAASARASYRIQKNAVSTLAIGNEGGHSTIEGVQIGRPIREHFNLNFGYDHIHQTYGNISAMANNPDNNHEYVGITYQFTRPLGR